MRIRLYMLSVKKQKKKYILITTNNNINQLY